MVEFGEARTEELPQLVSLLGMLFSEEAEFVADAAKQARALEAILSEPSLGTVFVAREGGRVIAMATLLYTVSTAEGGRVALFEDLVVLPERRGAGVGRRLVRYVIEEARRRGLLRLTLLTDMQNEGAQRLYRELGFGDSAMKPMRLKL